MLPPRKAAGPATPIQERKADMWDYAPDASALYGYDPFPIHGDAYVSYDSGLWTTYGDYAQYQSYYDYGVTTDTSGVMYDSYGNTSADYAAGSYSSYDTSSYGSPDTGSVNTYDITSIL